MKKTLLFLFILFAIATPVRAQQVGLSLSPSLNEVLLKPGASTELSFLLENIGDPALVSLKMIPITTTGNLGNVQFKSSSKLPIDLAIKEYSLSSNKSLILKTHETQKITLVIDAPENTKEGDYYYSLVAQTDPPPAPEGNVSARASIGIASNILISVMKQYPTESDASIVLFNIPSSQEWNILGNRLYFVDIGKPFELVFTLENKGIHRIKAEGSINIESGFGSKKSYMIAPQNVLAESQRTVQTNLPNRRGNTSFYLDSLASGIYTITGQIGVTATSTNLQSSIRVVSLPVSIIVLAMIGVTVLIVFLIIRRKKHNPQFESE